MADEEREGADPRPTRRCNKRDACCAKRPRQNIHYGTHRVPLEPGEVGDPETLTGAELEQTDREFGGATGLRAPGFGGLADAIGELRPCDRCGGEWNTGTVIGGFGHPVEALCSTCLKAAEDAGEVKPIGATTSRPDDEAPTAAEALFGFMGWLTSREPTAGPFSSRHNAAQAAELVGAYCEKEGIDPAPRPGWGTMLEEVAERVQAEDDAADAKVRGMLGDGFASGTKAPAPSSVLERAQADLSAIDGLEARAADAFQLTRDAEVADLEAAFDGGAAVMINPTAGELCRHGVTRVDANLIEKLAGDRVLEVTARCEKCRHRWVFNLRDALGITLNPTGTIARLDVVLGDLDAIRQCVRCHKDHDGLKEICPACLSEAAAMNKEARNG